MTTVPDDRLNAAIREVFDRTSGVTGQDFFDAITRALKDILGADIAMVGELDGPARIRSLSLCVDGAIAEPMSYDLLGTPCADVADGVVCHYPEGVADRFPADVMLRDMGIEGYAGVPLKGRAVPQPSKMP